MLERPIDIDHCAYCRCAATWDVNGHCANCGAARVTPKAVKAAPVPFKPTRDESPPPCDIAHKIVRTPTLDGIYVLSVKDGGRIAIRSPILLDEVVKSFAGSDMSWWIAEAKLANARKLDEADELGIERDLAGIPIAIVTPPFVEMSR